MGHPIRHAKLKGPRPPTDIHLRARLPDRLDKGHAPTLTSISAPAGYGKSTRAGRRVEAWDSQSGWVSLDEGDSDPATFLIFVLDSIQSLFPGTELLTA